LIWKGLSTEQIKNNLSELLAQLELIPESDWQASQLEEKIITWLKTSDQKLGDYLWPLRVALTGQKASPGPFEVASVIGQKESLKRITSALTNL
jgi:glutamyl-tRNA synthetase